MYEIQRYPRFWEEKYSEMSMYASMYPCMVRGVRRKKKKSVFFERRHETKSLHTDSMKSHTCTVADQYP